MKIEFCVEIIPKPTPRPRIYEGGVFYPKKYTYYMRELILKIKLLSIPNNDFYRLDARFFLPYAKSLPKCKKIDGKPCRKLCDNDNLAKGLMDALEKSGVVNDDRQFYITSQEKYFTVDKPRIEFELYS